ncbi:MAG: chromate transporter [Treponema sp.]|nr:chromate transporter [Treponema sp.]
MKMLYLFATFFRIGLFAIGGGYATLPFLFELADTTSGWLSREIIANILAVAQFSPGPVGSNIASYAGFLYAGIPGGFMATLGLIAPSIIIILIVARMLKAFKESAIVKSLFSGFRPAAAGLLSAACFGAIMLSLWNGAALVWYSFIRWKEALIFAVLFFLIYKFRKHPVVYIAAAGAIGMVLKL